jgi:hypothetical protein
MYQPVDLRIQRFAGRIAGLSWTLKQPEHSLCLTW